MFNGRRQPSHGGTSRMMREYQVRICERLGVKFLGPTRRPGLSLQQKEELWARWKAGQSLSDIRAYFGWIESGDSLGCLDERI
jgi:hypothetical protein